MMVELQRSFLSDIKYGVWLSLVERFVRDEEVAGSNPVTPTPWQGHRHVRISYMAGFLILFELLPMSFGYTSLFLFQQITFFSEVVHQYYHVPEIPTS